MENDDYNLRHPVKAAIKRLSETMKKLYGKPCLGGGRMAFFNGDWVIKIPRNETGISDTYREHRLFSQCGPNSDRMFPLAKCHIVDNEDGIPILYMEKVEYVPVSVELPGWTHFVDCSQVGYTKDGRLVAYDYGDQ